MLYRRKKTSQKIALALFILVIISAIFIATLYICRTTVPKPSPEPQVLTNTPAEIKEVEPKKTINITLTDPTAPKLTALPILMYHFFYDSNTGQTAADGNFIDVNVFDQQVKYLVDNNYYFPTWQEVKQFVAGEISLPEKSIVITDDDGSATFFDLAVPVLAKHKVPATSFLITSWTDPKNLNVDKSLITFQSHSHNMHQGGCEGGKGGLFRCLAHDEAISDLTTSKDILGSNDAFCYPFGDYTDQAIQELKEAGYPLAVTTEYGKADQQSDPLLLPRIRISSGTDLSSFISIIN